MRIAAEDGGVGVDDGSFADCRVTLFAADDFSVFVLGKAQRAECDPLIDFDVAVDDAGFADDDAGSVVDEERRADLGTGVNIDSGVGMRPLRHHTRDVGDVGFVEFVGETVDGDCFQAGIAEDDFVGPFGCRVTIESSLDVGREKFADGRESFEELQRDLDGALFVIVFLSLDAGFAPLFHIEVTKGSADLHGHPFRERIDQIADMVLNVSQVEILTFLIAWIEEFFEIIDDLHHLIDTWKWAVAEVVDGSHVLVTLDDHVRNFGETVFEEHFDGNGGGHGRELDSA